MLDSTLFIIGLAFVFFGVLLVFIALILSFSARTTKEAKVRGGGAIIIGPFPIIFGTDKESVKTLLLLSITLMIIAFLVLLILYILSR